MVYPLLPMFLAGLSTVQMAAIYVGIMDGTADMTSGLLKLLSGRWSDKTGRRKGWAIWGYTWSCLARSMMAAARSGWFVILMRVLDRIGKGLRTSPRDALLAGSVQQDVRALAFSFHRMMDHAGALTGPLLALGTIYMLAGSSGLWIVHSPAQPSTMVALRWVFALSVVPGLMAGIGLWLKVTETTVTSPPTDRLGLFQDGPVSVPRRFYLFLVAIALFALGNSSDLFLVLYAQDRLGLGPGWVEILWSVLHVSKIAWSLPGGRVADMFGRSRAILGGWLIYILVYVAMPFADGLLQVLALLCIYGSYYGLTEGAERALVADMADAKVRGWAYGLYHAVIAAAALPASLIFGLLFAKFGARAAFTTGAGLAACGTLVLLPLALRPTR
jgi:MFS family permease